MEGILNVRIGVYVVQEGFIEFVFNSLTAQNMVDKCTLNDPLMRVSHLDYKVICLTKCPPQSHSHQPSSPLPPVYVMLVQANQCLVCQSKEVLDNPMVPVQLQTVLSRHELLPICLLPHMGIGSSQPPLHCIILHNYITLSFILQAQNAIRSSHILSFQMSRMATLIREMESQPVLNTTLHKVTLNPAHFPAPPHAQHHHRRLLRNICLRIQAQERESQQLQAHLEASQQFAQLKTQLRKNISKQSIERIMGGEGRCSRSGLSSVMKTRTETVDVGVKYRRKIQMELELMGQAERIRNQKDEYARWYDSTNNSATNSPVYRKINYLLERMAPLQLRSSLGPEQRDNPTCKRTATRRHSQEAVH